MPSLDPSLPEGTIVCLDCDYQLRELTNNKCPECGRAFDPEKKESFYVVNYKFDWRLKSSLFVMYGYLTLVAIVRQFDDNLYLFLAEMLLALVMLPVAILSLSLIIAYFFMTRQPHSMKWTRTMSVFLLFLGAVVFSGMILKWAIDEFAMGFA